VIQEAWFQAGQWEGKEDSRFKLQESHRPWVAVRWVTYSAVDMCTVCVGLIEFKSEVCKQQSEELKQPLTYLALALACFGFGFGNRLVGSWVRNRFSGGPEMWRRVVVLHFVSCFSVLVLMLMCIRMRVYV
jgi:hypothetical protein